MASGQGNAAMQALLKLIYNATNWANIADNTATSPITNLYLSLHPTSPGASGTQTTNEAAYTSYARVAVPRTTGGFTVSNGILTLVANALFPAATGGSETETYVGIGTLSSGAGTLLAFGQLNSNIIVTTGVAPIVASGTIITES